MDFLKELPDLISKYAGAITSVAAVIALFVGYRVKTRAKRKEKQRENLGITLIESKVENIQHEISKHHEESSVAMSAMYSKMKELDDAQDEKIEHHFDQLTELMRDSERERLRDKIYEAADKARHGEYISGEYYSRIREILHKYEKLGGDGEAHGEWSFFADYYNRQNVAK